MSNGLVYLIAGVAFGGSFIVRWWLKRTYAKWSKVPNQHGITGVETATAILRQNGITGVTIEAAKGRLTDHYDPQRDILRLSEGNFASTSVAAMAVSAHEAGHALQDFGEDVRLRLRRFLVPLAALGGRFGPYVIVGALALQSDFLLRLGAFLLAGTMVFQILTLPVEFNASRRAMRNLAELGFTDPENQDGTRMVLTAAALTYVAAAATSVAYFLTLFAQSRRGRVL